jgi:DNA-binding NtrC family response regulator
MTELGPVLIVHPDPSIRSRLAGILEGAGLQVKAVERAPEAAPNGTVAVLASDPLDAVVRDEMTLRELSDLYTARILDRVNGNKVRAARILGINRRTLYRRGEARRRDAARAAGEKRERDR